MDNGDFNHFQSIQTLPRIKELVKPVGEVKSVNQPDGFFDGRPAEAKSAFYLRVSERLRHKGRGLNIWDIERLVLEQFPSIHQVKCFGNAGNEEFVKPGVIKIVVVPKIKSENEMPKVGFDRLIEISKYLKPLVSPVAEIDVINPVYEKVVINCDIKFKEEVKGEGLAINQLHEDVRNLLCPWLKGASLGMGGSIIQNELLNFIKDRPYIKFITSFSLLHIIEKEGYFSLVDSAINKKDTQILQASMPWSVLVPVKKHQVNLISKEVFKPSEITLINKMRLGTEFIITSAVDDNQIDEWLPKEQLLNQEEDEQSFWISDLDF